MLRIVYCALIGAFVIWGCQSSPADAEAKTDSTLTATPQTKNSEPTAAKTDSVQHAPSDSDVIGTWEATFPQEAIDQAKKEGAEVPTLSITFEAGGKFTAKSHIDKQDKNAGGTWMVKGNALTVVTSMRDGKALDLKEVKTSTVELSSDLKSFSMPDWGGAKFAKKN